MSEVSQMLYPLLSHAVTRSFTYDERAELFGSLVCQVTVIDKIRKRFMSVIAKQFLVNILTFTC